MVKRIHLFEFEDLPWFPDVLRSCITDFLTFACDTFDFYRPIIDLLELGLEKSGRSSIIDLGSGSGGGLRRIAEHLKKEVPGVKIVLTDLFPNVSAFRAIVNEMPAVFSFEERPVDAQHVPRDLPGFRTLFLSFHHFRPHDAQRILQDAVDSRVPIAIFETQKRDVGHLIHFAIAPLAVFMCTPWIRPFRWSRLLFTYVIPVVPFFLLWDAIVSVLRTHTADEMRQMVDGLTGDTVYHWQTGERMRGPVTVLYLLGYPKNSDCP